MEANIAIHSWEYKLLKLAREARPVAGSAQHSLYESAVLRQAHQYCAEITTQHSRSFYLATRLLPAQKRRAIRALYAFCRIADNLVDCPSADAGSQLALWCKKALSAHPRPDDLVAAAWADTRLRYQIPPRYAEQLIEGVAQDFTRVRYQTFEQLTAYAYGVASTVGLMSMYIIGFEGPEALPYAIKLGVALQITNILRDVGEDWRTGRLYLPGDELSAFGLDESDIAAGRVGDRWRAFMQFQIARNRRLYEESLPGVGLLHRDGQAAVAAAAVLYQGILDDIEQHDYDVFSRRAYLSGWQKLQRLRQAWQVVSRQEARQ